MATQMHFLQRNCVQEATRVWRQQHPSVDYRRRAENSRTCEIERFVSQLNRDCTGMWVGAIIFKWGRRELLKESKSYGIGKKAVVFKVWQLSHLQLIALSILVIWKVVWNVKNYWTWWFYSLSAAAIFLQLSMTTDRSSLEANFI